ncbi:MAG: hypothetical protein L3J81_06420, partial [Thermoplasmata archaeon]|nr:hypothetical protein [Thermoplasmata archaeon]
GRIAAAEERLDVARDRWSALVDRPGPVLYPRLRSEALIRLALLEFADHRPDDAKAHLERLQGDELRESIPRGWLRSSEGLAAAADDSRHGAGPLPQESRGR